MCKFLFEDIIGNPAFASFFRPGREFDTNFVYAVSFGFMPRLFLNTKEDRYILEEEGDVTEIYFIVNGEWAIGYNSFRNNVPTFKFQEMVDFPPGTQDINDAKIMIAKRYKGFGYIGDYYVFSSKKSQFTYMALTQVDSYALPKQFMFNDIFKKFPGLHSEMLAESFSRYVKEFRRPVTKKRNETILTHNKKSHYSKVSTEKQNPLTKSTVNAMISARDKDQQEGTSAYHGDPSKNPLKRSDSRTRIYVKQEELKAYKAKLDELNDKANTMFEHMKDINKLVNKKIMEIEHAVTKSEQNFVGEINQLITNKDEQMRLEKRVKKMTN